MCQCLRFGRTISVKVSAFFPRTYLFDFFHTGWHNKFNHRVDKIHPNVWYIFECLERHELLFRQETGKINCGMQKKTNEVGCFIRSEIKTLTERYYEKEITLLEFIYGLSTLVAQNSTTVL